MTFVHLGQKATGALSCLLEMTPARAMELMRLAMGFVQVLDPEHGIAPETEEERKLVIKLGSRKYRSMN